VENTPKNVPSVGETVHSDRHDCCWKAIQVVPDLHDSVGPCFPVAKRGRSLMLLCHFVARYQEGPSSYALDPSEGSISVTTPMSPDPAYDLSVETLVMPCEIDPIETGQC
jgi:hypothetical protein